jgi:hypothetical protein
MSSPNEPGRPPGGHLSSFHLEALRLGVASTDEGSWAQAHLASCARCAEQERALEGFRRDFVDEALPRTRAAVRAGVRRAQGRRPRWWAALVAAPLMAVLILVVWRKPPRPQGEEPAVSEKGGPALAIVARRGARVFPVRSGDPLQPGDQIRFVLKGVTYPYGMIASVDGAGRPNIYVPYEGVRSISVTPANELAIEGSIVLDGRLGPERVFALFSRDPLPAEAVRRALTDIGSRGGEAIRQTTALPVHADAQASLLIQKVSP